MPDTLRQIPRPPRAVTLDCWSTLLRDLDTGEALRRRASALSALATRLGRELSPEEAVATIEAAWSFHVGEWRGGR
ncbi:MAG TPA: hypothetical protein VKY26_11050, partial [Actinomycetota bacterium]|nr:hypothetical protein [Actinomycetota bacterium]